MKIAGPKFLLISDNTSYAVAGPRYLGPYRIAHELEAQGIQTFVLDKFYSFPDFFKFLELFLDEDFIGVGLSTTFFTPPEFNKEYDRYTPRHKLSRSYYDYGIISNDPILRKNWFEKFRAIITEKSPKAKVFVGGAKAQFFGNQLFNDITEIDYLVMGVVDKVFPEVLKDLIAGRDPHYKMMGNKRVVDTALQYKQPKVCPPHDWKKHWFVQPNEPLPIEIGRGCAFNCKFCNYDKNENFRKSLTDLKQEFISSYENFGVQNYHFVDDCFNDSRAKVEEVGQLLLSLPFKVEWASYQHRCFRSFRIFKCHFNFRGCSVKKYRGFAYFQNWRRECVADAIAPIFPNLLASPLSQMKAWSNEKHDLQVADEFATSFKTLALSRLLRSWRRSQFWSYHSQWQPADCRQYRRANASALAHNSQSEKRSRNRLKSVFDRATIMKHRLTAPFLD
ncbi:MAG: hypothetical protein J0L82_01325 [Deltaproteobacteria bacterium]|nr:hypothetical protein [Deltaproteobacteria bacterium]